MNVDWQVVEDASILGEVDSAQNGGRLVDCIQTGRLRCFERAQTGGGDVVRKDSRA